MIAWPDVGISTRVVCTDGSPQQDWGLVISHIAYRISGVFGGSRHGGNMVRNAMVSCMGGIMFRPHDHGKRQCTTKSVYILFAEVFKIKSGSIPNGADPMVEWVFYFLILPLALQLLFSRFISFRVIASFFRSSALGEFMFVLPNSTY